MPSAPYVLELSPPPDPWETARRFADRDHLVFFDSAGGPGELARYSYVTADPAEWFELSHCNPGTENPFDRLAAWLGSAKAATLDELPPFQAGFVGMFGYDLRHFLERFPRRHPDAFDRHINAPPIAFGRYEWVIAWDHQLDRAWIICHLLREPHAQMRRARERDLADMIRATMALPSRAPVPWRRPRPTIDPPNQFRLPAYPGVWSNFDRRGFELAIRRAVEYTHAGDCFQVNIAQRLLTPLGERPLELYGRLRRVNPAPFAAYFDGGGFQLLSASPERFLKMTPDGRIETRPIKGTRPRGATPEQDAALMAELLASPKDRAENVMIVDLLRNDLGRVCEFGSVKVESLCRLETYPTVHHLVSEVSGQLRPGLTALDLLKAAFPGGSVTGAPKVRAMEIIDELEPHARGAYCGSLGWIGFDGAMDTSILIRTFTASGDWLQFPVGGGIVADSDPSREYDETLHKAAGLLRALNAD